MKNPKLPKGYKKCNCPSCHTGKIIQKWAGKIKYAPTKPDNWLD